MKRSLTALAAVIAVMAAVPVVQAATLRQKYQHRYHQAKRHGMNPGRNIVNDGIKVHGHWRPASNILVARSARTLLHWLQPSAPRPGQYHTDRPNTTQSTGHVQPGLPDCTWRPESGGDYGAVNPSSGAYGRYQIIPSTWAAHCSDLDRSPGGQDQCAARVYEAQGAGAWVNC